MLVFTKPATFCHELVPRRVWEACNVCLSLEQIRTFAYPPQAVIICFATLWKSALLCNVLPKLELSAYALVTISFVVLSELCSVRPAS